MLEFIGKNIFKFKNKMKDKRGMTAIEMVIGVMIFIILLSFMMDILILFWKFSVVAQTTTQIARISGIQGGVLSGPPRDWPSGDGYINVSEMGSMIQNKLSTADIASNEWSVRVGNGRFGKDGNRSTGEIDYKDDFTVSTTINYRWDFMSNFIPGMDIEQSITARRPAMSEWKYNYGNWNGE